VRVGWRALGRSGAGGAGAFKLCDKVRSGGERGFEQQVGTRPQGRRASGEDLRAGEGAVNIFLGWGGEELCCGGLWREKKRGGGKMFFWARRKGKERDAQGFRDVGVRKREEVRSLFWSWGSLTKNGSNVQDN
jgi:hypothetical protein